MLGRTRLILRSGAKWWKEGKPDFARANLRKSKLEEKRLTQAHYLPPVEPTPQQATQLYRRLLKEGEKQLKVTDKDFFRRKVKLEFEVTSRQTSARVRGIMYEKGCWMCEHKLGGIV
ncbi:hypothetical protein AGDE_01185 [Angomonas deanei]|uniref:Complex 1 protein (LYR family), putative n=1 Tax=Angomonas deanei TaxID=59799 RepID=S9VGG7_9TRYP|nr:hypothetical protein AGDE_03935 [Angomonas deanei]EPY42679.1 hypothetical protein AGDE_01244 [Angomonas deanei]EPY42738.1 hypothetical protein AGDE_01185 [Angomonas deanei]CAD2222641.1 Complex 1 protein (LYR family), putative [Angomonas deanei]|eukprot:EPY39993.1 hypothetical protein AGDE_03935 [Angomonas deanei]